MTTKEVEWRELIQTALTSPGNLNGIYSRFHNYSFNNQVLLMMQGVTEPVATYRKWDELGYQVKKGSKARWILRPCFVKDKENEDRQKLIGFKMLPCLFPVSDTDARADAEEIPPPATQTWDAATALVKLDVSKVEYQLSDGNIQGYSTQRQVAISPVAAYPFKTLIHELAHVMLGHTTTTNTSEHRGTVEFQAETVAILVCKELELPAEWWDESASRAYIQHWLQDELPDDKHIKEIFSATQKILVAGRPEAEKT